MTRVVEDCGQARTADGQKVRQGRGADGQDRTYSSVRLSESCPRSSEVER